MNKTVSKIKHIGNIVITIIFIIFYSFYLVTLLERGENVGMVLSRLNVVFFYIASLVIFNSICNLLSTKSEKN